MSICLYASSQDAEGQTLASLSVSGHAIIKPTSITTNGALSHGPLSYNWVMKTHYRTLSHYFYSWIQRTTSFGSLVFFKLISGISLACWTLWICAGQCFHAYIMCVCERERLWERKVMKEGPAAGVILVLAVRRADDATTGGFEFVFCMCDTNPFYTHWLIHSQVYI